MTGPAHYEAFLKDLKSRTGKFTLRLSSTKKLVEYLGKTKGNPKRIADMEAAKALCENPKDKRLEKYEPALRALVKVWGTPNAYQAEPVKPKVSQSKDKYAKHAGTWSNLTITDIPAGERGVYKVVQGFDIATNVMGVANGWAQKTAHCKGDEVQGKPHYWLKLGQMAGKVPRSSDKKRYVRCFSCAAIAAHSLVMDHDFDDVDFAVVGSKDFDHYFVVVGDPGRIKKKDYTGAKAVDLWQYNLDPKNWKAVNDLEGFRYAQNVPTFFCEFTSDLRTVHSQILKSAE